MFLTMTEIICSEAVGRAYWQKFIVVFRQNPPLGQTIGQTAPRVLSFGAIRIKTCQNCRSVLSFICEVTYEEFI